MNNHYSSKEYLSRYVEKSIIRAFNATPVVILTGARQTGKSTLMRHLKISGISNYYSGDSYSDIDILKTGGDKILKLKGITIIDEVQKIPWILNTVKIVVDETNRRKKFLLSGSANILLARNITESLAGRASFLNIFPFTINEYLEIKNRSIFDILIDNNISFKKIKKENIDLNKLLWGGLLPVPLLKLKEKDIPLWWEGYVNTYLERDMRDISSISDLSDYRKFMKVLSCFSGSSIEETTIARETAISQPTVHRYLNLLEASNIIIRLPVYHMNKKKRIIKKPKIYWFDTGIINYLRNNLKKDTIEKDNLKGFLFEHFVLNHILVWSSLQFPRASVYYWRTVNGDEVDFIVEYLDKIVAVEVKLSNSVNYADAKGILKFFNVYPQTKIGYIVYTGKEIKQLAEKIYAIPYWMI